eukprot:jgi/Mesen1/2574/ME000162S01699
MPFHPRDLLPLLPHAVSYNIMQNLRSPVDIFPAYVGSLVPGEVLNWTGTCFRENLGFVNLTEGGKGAGDQGGLVVNVVPFAANVTPAMAAHFQSGDFIVTSKVRGFWGGFETLQKWVTGSWSGHTAMFMRDANGTLWVAESGHLTEQVSVVAAAVAATPAGSGAGSGAVQVPVRVRERVRARVQVRLRMRVPVRMEPIIQTQTFEAWWAHQLADPDEPSIAVLPLHPRLRKIFNETAAWEFVTGMEGQPFGFHNIIFSWIDTPKDNYPPPINSQLASPRRKHALRRRPSPFGLSSLCLSPYGLDVAQVLAECAARRIPFGELLAVPERDSWQYSDGKSTSCVAYVMTAWKDGGLFGANASDIQVTEFTLNFFDDDAARIGAWCPQSASSPKEYCQILGKWRLDLPGFNTLEPYPRMNEACPSMAPDYYRPRSIGCGSVQHWLNFFDDDAARIGAWCPQSASSPKEYCQILGKWRLDLPGFNTLEPYPRMNEACPSMAPDYYRPSNC